MVISDYMAASRRSPLMRDQWRAGDDHRDSNRRRNRGTDDRRKISPAAPRETDVGLKIKGRAAADSAPGSPSDHKRSERDNTLGKDRARGSSRSPPRRRPRDEELVQRRESSGDRYPERPRHRDEGGQTDRRRITRSRSPQRELFGFREERRRHRSPIHSGRTDTFRPSSRRRERANSPPRSNRGDHYSSTYTDLSGSAGRFGDSVLGRETGLQDQGEFLLNVHVHVQSGAHLLVVGLKKRVNLLHPATVLYPALGIHQEGTKS
ncbi:hypothetical protein HO133_005462 [Letharia lupina]|uniref:Uncharacterized protein n=1 Tax=Letharia lupina TaxID=560253 RepID=A0A8H6C934_9LECA|nr:uncharacterized protein HO133_005462 [Letharia lupina]KAF6218919.1 hypothetical protein HO133_005462 [Letharia lupina]